MKVHVQLLELDINVQLYNKIKTDTYITQLSQVIIKIHVLMKKILDTFSKDSFQQVQI
jgi:hypothetical protein